MADEQTGATLPVAQYNIQWRRAIGQYSTGSVCYLGKWTVGAAFYDAGRSRHEAKKHQARVTLPGIKLVQGYYHTEEEARAQVEKIVRYWLDRLSTEKPADA